MKNDHDNSLFRGFNSLGEIGEFGLIDQIAGLFGRKFEPDTIGIGDDCAVLPYHSGRSLLVTTDMLIEDRHFRRDWISAEDLGYKYLAVNMSDISAMGGRPEYAFLSIGLADEIPLEWLEQFFREAYQLCQDNGVKLLGGDTTKSPGPMVINYTVLGSVATENILWRSAAKPGDRIALLGNVGESGAGLNLLMKHGSNEDRRYRQLIKAHNRPGLFIEEAQFLAGFPAVHAMIDLSDGISSDAGHIASRSSVALKIDVEQLPIRPVLREVCDEFSWSAEELALTAGEDYGLLFTIDESGLDQVMTRFEETFGYRFTVIGQVEDGDSKVFYFLQGNPFSLEKHGFDHFKS
jgi:thiamine-monophosphate kinase